MSVIITPESLYSEYVRELCFQTRGIYPRRMKNFDKVKTQSYWVFFVKAAQMIQDSDGHIDPSLYIKGLVVFYQGKIDYSVLGTMKAIKIYKNYIETISCDRRNLQEVDAGINRSIMNMCRFMNDNNMTNTNEYFNFNAYLIPRLAKDLNSGAISKHFLSIVPEINLIISNYPQDIQDEYFIDFLKEFQALRLNLFKYEKYKIIYDNFEIVINKTLTKLKTQTCIVGG